MDLVFDRALQNYNEVLLPLTYWDIIFQKHSRHGTVENYSHSLHLWGAIIGQCSSDAADYKVLELTAKNYAQATRYILLCNSLSATALCFAWVEHT